LDPHSQVHLVLVAFRWSVVVHFCGRKSDRERHGKSDGGVGWTEAWPSQKVRLF
jgi:hypothetical protein